MKHKLFSLLLYLVFTTSTISQGTIILSNVGLVPVSFGFSHAGPDTCVSFALPNGTLVGSKAKIIGAGFFSAGVVTLVGLTGEVTLVLAAWHEGSDQRFFSDPFTVDIGDGGEPPARIPASFSGVMIGVLTPSPQPHTKQEWITINKRTSHYFFKAKDLKFIKREKNRILIEYTDFSITSGRNILIQN